MGDLFSNMYIIAVVGVVVQYLISGKGNGVAGWVLPVISLAVVTYCNYSYGFLKVTDLICQSYTDRSITWR